MFKHELHRYRKDQLVCKQKTTLIYNHTMAYGHSLKYNQSKWNIFDSAV